MMEDSFLRCDQESVDTPSSVAVARARFGAPGPGRPRRRPPGTSRSHENAGGDPGAATANDDVLFAMFAATLIGITFFQKIGLGPNPDAIVPAGLVIGYGALAAGMLLGRPVIRPGRAALYLAFVLSALVGTVFFAREYSHSSMLLAFLLYLPMLVAFPATQRCHQRCMAFFSDLMLFFAGVEMVQHAVQLTMGPAWWPNLDQLVPARFLIPDFIYLQPIARGMDLMKPNGVVFLEVSVLSQFLTIALIAEILFFRRLWRITAFAAAILASFAGTGLLLFAISAPVLFGQLRARSMLLVLLALFAVGLIAVRLGWYDIIANRAGEFDHYGTSGNMRFVEPLNRILDALRDPAGLYSGIGAGRIEKGIGYQWWPVTKLIVEYGLVQCLLFYAFFVHAMLDRTPSTRLALTLIVWFSLEGSLLTTFNVMACMMLSTMFLHQPAPRGRRRAGAPHGGESMVRAGG